MMKNKLIILLGGSCSGKTTTEIKLREELGYSSVISCTTREKRPKEIEGIDYYFISVEELLKEEKANQIKIDEDWYYGVRKKELLKDNNLVYSVINIEPAYHLIEHIKNNNIPLEIIIIYFDIPVDFRAKKMIERGENQESVYIRLGREDKIENLDFFNLKADYIVKEMNISMQDDIMDFLCQKN